MSKKDIAKNGIGMKNVNAKIEAMAQAEEDQLMEHLAQWGLDSCQPYNLQFIFRYMLERYSGNPDCLLPEMADEKYLAVATRAINRLKELLTEAHKSQRGVIHAHAEGTIAQLKTRSLRVLERHRRRIDEQFEEADIIATTVEGQTP